MAGFNTAVTGIKATTTALDVTGNNIANASTVGFKSTRAEFGDIYATQVVGAGSSNLAGSGVLISDLSQDFSSGTIEFTNSNLDLAINGSGFFQLDDGQGGVTYTRGGAFELDKDGNIISKNGKYLQGYGLDAQGNQLPIGNLQVKEKESPPHATENIGLSVNLEPEEELEKKADYYTKTNASSYSYTTTVKTYDSLGNEQSIKFNYVEQKPQREVHSFTAPALLLQGDPTTKPFVISGSNVASISGVPIQWATEAAPGTAITPPMAANTLFVPTAATITELEAADPRIDTATIRFDSTDNKLTYKLKSEATGQGDVVVNIGDGTDPIRYNNTNVDSQGRPGLVDSNESITFTLQAPGTAPFTGTNDTLATDIEIQVGGVNITLKAGVTVEGAGKAIATQYDEAIKDNDPNIESITYDETTRQVTITWKPEAGDVYQGVAYKVDGNVDETGNANSLFVLAAPATATADDVAITTVEGDNSYLGTYRVYAYLNDEQLLNIGKQIDPGESTDPPAVQNFVAGTGYSEPGPVVIKFSSSTGLIESINGDDVRDQDNVPKLTIRGADKANPDDALLGDDLDNLQGVQFDISGTTRWESPSIVKGQSQDGYAKGDLIGVSFDEQGRMVAAYSNGQRKDIGIVALATFESQSGLQPAGDTEWVPTLDSGQASLNPPGTGLNGTIRSGALEQSNVDLSAELVKLIEFQRNYQANSKTLETLNTVTQSILQI